VLKGRGRVGPFCVGCAFDAGTPQHEAIEQTSVMLFVIHSDACVRIYSRRNERTNAAGVGGGGGGLRVRPSVCTPPVWLLLLISERAMCRVRRAEAYRPDRVFGPR